MLRISLTFISDENALFISFFLRFFRILICWLDKSIICLFDIGVFLCADFEKGEFVVLAILFYFLTSDVAELRP